MTMYRPLSRKSNRFLNPIGKGRPLGRAGCVLLVLWSLILTGGFCVAFSLEPDPRGYGTHEQLGLPPCTFQSLSGQPCPSCGMTTSFAHLSEGRIVQSARANAAGLILSLVCLVQIPWCWLSAGTGWLIGLQHPERAVVGLLSLVALLMIGQWILRLTG